VRVAYDRGATGYGTGNLGTETQPAPRQAAITLGRKSCSSSSSRQRAEQRETRINYGHQGTKNSSTRVRTMT
jgi:hypothetical protein